MTCPRHTIVSIFILVKTINKWFKLHNEVIVSFYFINHTSKYPVSIRTNWHLLDICQYFLVFYDIIGPAEYAVWLLFRPQWKKKENWIILSWYSYKQGKNAHLLVWCWLNVRCFGQVKKWTARPECTCPCCWWFNANTMIWIKESLDCPKKGKEQNAPVVVAVAVAL